MKDTNTSLADESFVILDDGDPLLETALAMAHEVAHDQAQTIAAATPASRRTAFPGRPAQHPSSASQGRPDVGLAIVRQVAALATMDTNSLRNEWRCVFNNDPPGYAKELLRRRIAYRIQEIAYGGLPDATRKQLREVETPEPKARPMSPGTVLIREYKGVKHEVMAVVGGFQYQNRLYKSLSGIAKEIVGSLTDGPLFFGLRKKKPRKP